MAGGTRESGKIIICTDTECILGETAGVMKVCMKETRNMVMVYITGQMEGNMKVIG